MCNFVSTFTQHESSIGINAEAVTSGLNAAYKGLIDRRPSFGPAFGRKNLTHMLSFCFKNVFPAYKLIYQHYKIYLPTGSFYASSTAISTFLFVRL